jgi:hypothetical protein
MQIGTRVGYSITRIKTIYRKGAPKETGGRGGDMMRGWHADSEIKILGILVS